MLEEDKLFNFLSVKFAVLGINGITNASGLLFSTSMHAENDLIDFRRENSFEIGDPNLSLIQWTFVGLIFVVIGFIFVHVGLNSSHYFLILFNMGAPHNFVTKKLFATLGVQVNKCPSKVKVIKSQLQTIYGIDYEVQF